MNILKYLLVLLPSRIKILCYRAMGASIGKNCRIGFSIINATNLDIGDQVYIGNFNIIVRLKSLTLETGSRINRLNWISGAREGTFRLGRNSAITELHYIEASSNITVGDNSMIAGRSSHLFSHGITPTNLDEKLPIVIGNWCYIGSSSRFVPGSGVSDRVFVGMGAVVTKHFADNNVLIAGIPAIVKKALSPEDIYFNRTYLPHDHHLKSYKG